MVTFVRKKIMAVVFKDHNSQTKVSGNINLLCRVHPNDLANHIQSRRINRYKKVSKNRNDLKLFF